MRSLIVQSDGSIVWVSPRLKSLNVHIVFVEDCVQVQLLNCSFGHIPASHFVCSMLEEIVHIEVR